MWIVAGLLLGVVAVASVAAFHTGPHAHVAAGAAGVVAAFWLVAMAVTGSSAPVLWVLLGADLALAGGMGVMGWVGLAHRNAVWSHARLGRLEGSEGVAVTDLAPDGIVRVRGEQWSATCLNGTVHAGTPVQVLQADGVRLGVWGEGEDDTMAGDLPTGRDRRQEETST